jgi:hypothetical protein
MNLLLPYELRDLNRTKPSGSCISVGRRFRRRRGGGAANHEHAAETKDEKSTHQNTPGMSWFSYAGNSMSWVM